MRKPGTSLKKRLNMLLIVCLLPLIGMIFYLIFSLNRFSASYDAIVRNITRTNEYSDFKEEIDYIMYVVVANSERAQELVDTERPHEMIRKAGETFRSLLETASGEPARKRLENILTCLRTLESRVTELESSALVSGSYEKNTESLDLNIRVLTELIQEQIQDYIYYETGNLETMRGKIRSDVVRAIAMSCGMLAVIVLAALFASRKIVSGITRPIKELCEVTNQVAQGDFGARAQEEQGDELMALSASFNRMVERIGKLTEDIRMEQRNLRVMELKLLQAQINPHFLYNTLDAIVWLAESGKKEEVVQMVTALSHFFRTTLSNGRDFISVEEEEAHIRSYLEIQQIRYQDILEYEIRISPELRRYEILKITLQPLVENALYHGIKKKRGKGHILVTGQMEDGKMAFRVRDDGIGMDEEKLACVRGIIRGEGKASGDASGFGLFNVDQRIRLNYGPEYGLTLRSEAGRGTEAMVVIPAVENHTFSEENEPRS